MTLPFGRLEEFNPEAGSFSACLERAELFFMANSIADDKKVPIFLHAIGATVYSTLRELLAPANPVTVSFADISATLKSHYEPKSLVIVERFHFHKREQAAGETIAEYIAQLRRLAAKCAFAGHLDKALWDRFVCGLKSEATQKRLLTEGDLTLAKAVEVAQNMEAAHNNAQAMKQFTLVVGEVAPVDQPEFRDTQNVRTFRSQSDGNTPGQGASAARVCYGCGSNTHSGFDCIHKDTSCHKCSKLGHLARVCCSGGRGRKGGRLHQPRGRQSWVDTPDYPGDQQGVEDLWEVLTAGPQVKPYRTTLTLNGTPVPMEIDTGAAVTLISESTMRSLLPHLHLSKPTMRLRTYTAQPIDVIRQARVEVKYKEYVGSHVLTVVKGKGPALLGRDWLSCIKLDWAAIRRVGSQIDTGTINQLLSQYASVFSTDPGTMKHMRAHLTLRDGAIPRVHAPRSVPYAIRDMVGRELDRLEEAGVIRKVNHAT